MQFGLGVGDVDPGEDVEAGDRRFAVIVVGNADMDHPFALAPQGGIQHRSELGRGIEDHAAAGPGQSGRDGGRRLEPAGACEDEAVSAAVGAGIDEERRLAAHAPAALVGRIEGDAGNALVVIDAVRLANGDAAMDRVRPGEEFFGIAERSPLAVAVIVGDAALDRAAPRRPAALSAGAGRGSVGATPGIAPNSSIARTIVGAAAASTSQKFTHQLACHHCVASHQARGVNGVPVPLLHSAEAATSQRPAAATTARHDGGDADADCAGTAIAHSPPAILANPHAVLQRAVRRLDQLMRRHRVHDVRGNDVVRGMHHDADQRQVDLELEFPVHAAIFLRVEAGTLPERPPPYCAASAAR